jgi:hypothetical protein
MAEQSKSTRNDVITVSASPNGSAKLPAGVPADYTRTVNVERHLNEHVHGNRTTFDQTSQTDDTSNGTFDNRVMEIVNGALQDRKKAEDKRANERNRNRILILVVVLVMEMAVPTLYGMHLLPSIFLKYEVLAITAPDALLTVYAYVRKY